MLSKTNFLSFILAIIPYLAKSKPVNSLIGDDAFFKYDFFQDPAVSESSYDSDFFASDFEHNFQQPLYQSVNEQSGLLHPSSSLFGPIVEDDDPFGNGGYSNDDYSDFQLPLIPETALASQKNTGFNFPSSSFLGGSDLEESFSSEKHNEPFGGPLRQKETDFGSLDYLDAAPTYGAEEIQPSSEMSQQLSSNDFLFSDSFQSFPESSISKNALDDFGKTDEGISSFKNILSNKLSSNNILKETFSGPLDETITDAIDAVANSVAKSFHLENYQAYDHYDTAIRNVSPDSDPATYIDVLARATDDLLKETNIMDTDNTETNSDLAATAINEGILNLKKEKNTNNKGFLDAFDNSFSFHSDFDLNKDENVMHNTDFMEDLEIYEETEQPIHVLETLQPKNVETGQQDSMNNSFENTQLDDVPPGKMLPPIVIRSESTTQPLIQTDFRNQAIVSVNKEADTVLNKKILGDTKRAPTFQNENIGASIKSNTDRIIQTDFRNQAAVSAYKEGTAGIVLENDKTKRVPLASTFRNENMGKINTNLNANTVLKNSETKSKDGDVVRKFSDLLKSKILESRIVKAGYKKDFSGQDITSLIETYSRLLSNRFGIDANLTNLLHTAFTKSGFEKDEETIAKIVSDVTGDVLNKQRKLIPSKLEESVDTAVQCIELSLVGFLKAIEMDMNTALQASSKDTTGHKQKGNLSSIANLNPGKKESQTETSNNSAIGKSRENKKRNFKESSEDKSVESTIYLKNADKTDMSVDGKLRLDLNKSTEKQQNPILNGSTIKLNTDSSNVIEISTEMPNDSNEDLRIIFSKELKTRIIESAQIDALIERKLTSENFTKLVDLYSRKMEEMLNVKMGESAKKALHSRLRAGMSASDYAGLLSSTTASLLLQRGILKSNNFNKMINAAEQCISFGISKFLDSYEYVPQISHTEKSAYVNIKQDFDAKTQTNLDGNNKILTKAEVNINEDIDANVNMKQDFDAKTQTNLDGNNKILTKAEVNMNEDMDANVNIKQDFDAKTQTNLNGNNKILTKAEVNMNEDMDAKVNIKQDFDAKRQTNLDRNSKILTKAEVNMNEDMDANVNIKQDFDVKTQTNLDGNNKILTKAEMNTNEDMADTEKDFELETENTIRGSAATDTATNKESLITDSETDADKLNLNSSVSSTISTKASTQNQVAVDSKTSGILSSDKNNKIDLELGNNYHQNSVDSAADETKQEDNNNKKNAKSKLEIQQKFATDFGSALATSEDFKLSIITRDMETIISAIADAVEAASGPQTSDAFLKTFNASLKS